ncbi:hypothetical protein [Actinacidiphila acididurans]|uniref:CHAT domain-containing protein n=1 Tax=Actinacidiphila acididurans TaxID=2784346 RepID=A0ABS2U3H5_9ACTN|nr:hypothetical protein [Actinacidiphila acididurans]MBM9510153.1 hypothetical protein [Actinacidiphila acididurans]
MAGSDEAARAALAELLRRACLDEVRPGDAEAARLLLRTFVRDDLDAVLLAAGTGGVWAAYRPDEELDADIEAAALASARALLGAGAEDGERALAASALALMAVRGAGERPGADLVAAAAAARSCEQHDVALWAGRQALAVRKTLSASDEALALLTVAVLGGDPAAVEELYEATSRLPPDDIAVRSAEGLRPTLRPAGGRKPSAAGRALAADDRKGAAAAAAAEIAELRRHTDDDLLSGLHMALRALAVADIQVEAARRGLISVLGHLRRRQHFGEVPPVARAGLELVADLLALDPTLEAVNVLAELLEAMADAGLSEIAALPDAGELPELAQARLALEAQRHPLWPDLAACVTGLRGRPGLLLRCQRMLSTGEFTVRALLVTPPRTVAMKRAVLNRAETSLLDRLAGGDPREIAGVTAPELDGLVESLLPDTLVARLAGPGLGSLVIVPDGPLWSVPWQAAAALSRTSVTLSPSLAVHARLRPFAAAIRRVTAVLDDDAPGGDLVFDALQEARAGGRLDVRLTAEPGGTPTDLLLVFAHGGGTGLGFRTGAAGRPLGALALAGAAPPPNALIAACWSAAAPPTSFPINLPAAMLLNGTSTVVGGLWPLPGLPTARIVSALIGHLADHGRLLPALAAARSAVPADSTARWGLVVHGAAPDDHPPA